MKKYFILAVLLICGMAQSYSQGNHPHNNELRQGAKQATQHTAERNRQWFTRLDFSNDEELQNARRTFMLDLTWKFNEARSKYRGSGAGDKQKARM